MQFEAIIIFFFFNFIYSFLNFLINLSLFPSIILLLELSSFFISSNSFIFDSLFFFSLIVSKHSFLNSLINSSNFFPSTILSLLLSFFFISSDSFILDISSAFFSIISFLSFFSLLTNFSLFFLFFSYDKDFDNSSLVLNFLSLSLDLLFKKLFIFLFPPFFFNIKIYHCF